jgi:hypothetical protein
MTETASYPKRTDSSATLPQKISKLTTFGFFPFVAVPFFLRSDVRRIISSECFLFCSCFPIQFLQAELPEIILHIFSLHILRTGEIYT